MKPIYFPFTYVSKTVAEALSACFERTVVYQPSRHPLGTDMRARVDQGRLEIRIPVEGDEEKMAAAAKNYRDWVALHQGGALDVLKTRRNVIPFFEDTAVTRLKADIQKHPREKQAENPQAALFNQRLFLHIAQEFDCQNDLLNQDLAVFDTLEQELVKTMQGEEGDPPGFMAAARRAVVEDPGLYMPEERLTAWEHLRRLDPETMECFVTTSRAVWEYLSDLAPAVEAVIRFDAVPVGDSPAHAAWRQALQAGLMRLKAADRPAAPRGFFEIPPIAAQAADGGRTVALTVYIAAGQSPAQFFGRCLKTREDPIQDQVDPGSAHTVLGLLDL